MARFSGKGGSVTIGSAIYNIRKWTLNIAADNRDVTAFGDTWKATVGGDPGYTFDLEGFLDSATLPVHPTTAGSPGSTVAFTFLQDTTKGYTGIGVISSMVITVGKDGTADVTLAGTGDQTLYAKSS